MSSRNGETKGKEKRDAHQGRLGSVSLKKIADCLVIDFCSDLSPTSSNTCRRAPPDAHQYQLDQLVTSVLPLASVCAIIDPRGNRQVGERT